MDGRSRTPGDGSEVESAEVESVEVESAAAERTKTTGRGVGVAVALTLPVALVVAWIVQLSAMLSSEFGPTEERTGGLGLTVWLVVGAAIGVGVPLAVLIGQVRARRRDPSLSGVALVAATLVLVVGLATCGLVVVVQISAATADLYRTAQPPTAAEQRYTGDEAGVELRALGDDTVRALGGDPDEGFGTDGSNGRAWSEECLLDNDDPGVVWNYWYHADSLVDASGDPLLPDGVDVLPGTRTDLDGVRELWSGEGIGAEQDQVDFEQVVPVVDWLERWSYVRAGPTVDITTICLMP